VRATKGPIPARSCTTPSVGPGARSDIVLADTAGRRSNSTNLLDELAKIRRVADREPGEVVETFMVLDATRPERAQPGPRVPRRGVGDRDRADQARRDARGGIVIAIERELGIAVKYVGIGEGVDDLIVFDPQNFVDSLLDA